MNIINSAYEDKKAISNIQEAITSFKNEYYNTSSILQYANTKINNRLDYVQKEIDEIIEIIVQSGLKYSHFETIDEALQNYNNLESPRMVIIDNGPNINELISTYIIKGGDRRGICLSAPYNTDNYLYMSFIKDFETGPAIDWHKIPVIINENLTVDKINGAYARNQNEHLFNNDTIPKITASGLIELGNVINMHYNDTYNTITSNANGININLLEVNKLNKNFIADNGLNDITEEPTYPQLPLIPVINENGETWIGSTIRPVLPANSEEETQKILYLKGADTFDCSKLKCDDVIATRINGKTLIPYDDPEYGSIPPYIVTVNNNYKTDMGQYIDMHTFDPSTHEPLRDYDFRFYIENETIDNKTYNKLFINGVDGFENSVNINTDLIINGATEFTGDITGDNITATGNISGVNGTFTGDINTARDITGNSISSTTTITATGDISGDNITATGDITATNGTFTGDINTAGDITATDGTFSGDITGNSISSETTITATGNITTLGNISGVNLTTSGTITATGDINAVNLTTSGTITATGDITGNNISATGDINAVNLTTSGTITATGDITGNSITSNTTITATGDITTLGDINAVNLTTSGDITSNDITATGDISGVNLTASGTITAAGDITTTADISAVDGTFSGDITGNSITSNSTITATGNITTSANISANNATITNNLTASYINIPDTFYNETSEDKIYLYVSADTTFDENVLINNDLSVSQNINTTTARIHENINTPQIRITRHYEEEETEKIENEAILKYAYNSSSNKYNPVINISDNKNLIINQCSNLGESTEAITRSLTLLDNNGNTILSGNITAVDGTFTGDIISDSITTNNINLNGDISAENITATGDITGNSIISNSTITATGDITGNNINAASDITGNSISSTTTITATGDITGNNINAASDITAVNGTFTGDISGVNLTTSGTITATGDITGNNINATSDITAVNGTFTGIITATGDITTNADISGVNLTTSGTITATGDITGNNITAVDGTFTGDITAVNLTTSGTITATGDITGNDITATGDITAVNLTTSGTITATGNITGNDITATGDISGVNLTTSGTITATGNISGNDITAAGDISGVNLTTSGTITATGNITTLGDISVENITATGTITATGDIITNADISVVNLTTTGTITAVDGTFTGDITAVNLTTSGTITATGNITTNADIEAVDGTFTGDISGVNITASDTLTGAKINISQILQSVEDEDDNTKQNVNINNKLISKSYQTSGQTTGDNPEPLASISEYGAIKGVNLTTSGDGHILGNLSIGTETSGTIPIYLSNTGDLTANNLTARNNITATNSIISNNITVYGTLYDETINNEKHLSILSGATFGENVTMNKNLTVLRELNATTARINEDIDTPQIRITRHYEESGTAIIENEAIIKYVYEEGETAGTGKYNTNINIDDDKKLIINQCSNLGDETTEAITRSLILLDNNGNTTLNNLTTVGNMSGVNLTASGTLTGSVLSVSSTSHIPATIYSTDTAPTILIGNSGSTNNSADIKFNSTANPKYLGLGFCNNDDKLTIDTNGNTNITGTLTTTGDITAGGDISAVDGTFTGDLTAINSTLSGDLSVNDITATGDISGVNLTTSGAITATGNITGNDITASGVLTANAITSTTTISATTNITAGGNITATGDITCDDMNATTLTTTGDITAGGDISAVDGPFTGTLTAANLSLSNNITISGTLTAAEVDTTDLNVSGTLTTANMSLTGNFSAPGSITAGTTLNATTDITAGGDITATGNATITGTTTAGQIETSTYLTANAIGMNLIMAITDLIYPVGSIYTTYDSTANPATMFGGTWERIKDVFLYATDPNNPPAQFPTGGSATHNHEYKIRHAEFYGELHGSNATTLGTYDYNTNQYVNNSYHDGDVECRTNNTTDHKEPCWIYNVTGNTSYEQNLPPYQCVYMFRRLTLNNPQTPPIIHNGEIPQLIDNVRYIFIGARFLTLNKTGANRYKKAILGYFTYAEPLNTISPGFIKITLTGTGDNIYTIKEYQIFYSNDGTGHTAYLKCYHTDGTTYSGGTFDLIIRDNSASGYMTLLICVDGYDDIDSIGCYITATIPKIFKLYDDTTLTTELNTEKTLTWEYSDNPN